MPSIAIIRSLVSDPCTLMLYCPSTLNTTVVPGMSSARAGVLRIGVGIESSTSRFATNSVVFLTTSTIGDSAVTVSVSSIAPTWSSAFTVGVKVPSSTMPPRRTLLNPANVNAT